MYGKMEKVGPVGKYLGCDFKRQTSILVGQPIQAIEHDRRQLMRYVWMPTER